LENNIQDMTKFTVAGRRFELEHDSIERALMRELPDPIREHYVVVCGRRFPPKQVLGRVTGLDRADFTTHQARRILRRLGFVAARASGGVEAEGRHAGAGEDRYGAAQAAALEPFIGQWVALAGPTEVLVAADTPQEILSWLARHERKAIGGMFRVPESAAQAEGAAPE
jgi:hypothetical protein